MNSSVLQEKLLEKIKQVKFLEKELKDKGIIIKNLHGKIDYQNEEISRLNNILTDERNSTLKVEVSILNRKLNEKEKLIEENNKKFEAIINEFKHKITNLIRYNDAYASKLHELRKFNDDSKNEVQELIEYQNCLNDKYNDLKIVYQKEVENGLDTKNQYSALKNKVGSLIKMILEVFKNHNINHQVLSSFLSKLNFFYSSSSNSKTYDSNNLYSSNYMNNLNTNKQDQFDSYNNYENMQANEPFHNKSINNLKVL